MLEEPITMSSSCERLPPPPSHVTSAMDTYSGHVTTGYQTALLSPPPPPPVSTQMSPPPRPASPPAADRAADRGDIYAHFPPALLAGVFASKNPFAEKPLDSEEIRSVNGSFNGTHGTGSGESGLPREVSEPPAPVRPESNGHEHVPGLSGSVALASGDHDVPAPAVYSSADGGDAGLARRPPSPADAAEGATMLRVRELPQRADSVLRFGDRLSSSNEPENGDQYPATAAPDHEHDTSGASKPASHSSGPSDFEHGQDDEAERSRSLYDATGGCDSNDRSRSLYDATGGCDSNGADELAIARERYHSERDGVDSRGGALASSADAFGREKVGEVEPAWSTQSVPGLNALARLQHALEKNGTFNVYKEEPACGGGGEIYQCHLCSYTGSSKFHFSQHMHSHYDFKCSQCDFTTHSNISLKEHMKDEHGIEIKDFMDEPGVRVPRVNASGKVRLHKCKFCDFKTATQVEHWEHLKTHIAPEKRFWCHVCPFITDVKHHLTYHLRNHFNSKPFKCNKCEYSCVNKSMLSSHMKSHTNFYQYRCGDCNFAAKYANALKNHLRKEKHRPGMVLNPDGSPNPFVIIDVYGTRRGPKIKKDEHGMPILPSTLQGNYASFLQSQNQLVPCPTGGGEIPSPHIKSEQSGLPPESPDKLAVPRGFIRCDMCPYSTPDRDQLTKHMMNHMTPDSQQGGSPVSSKCGDDGREPSPPLPPPKELPGLGRMELLRSALAQPVRLSQTPISNSAPPGYWRAEPPAPPPQQPELPRLPQYDTLAAHRVREYFSRALQTPFLYNLQMAAGLNNGGGGGGGNLPLPFSVSHNGAAAPPAAPQSPPHTRVSPRPSSPPFYERAPAQQQESPQPSSPAPPPPPPPPAADTALDLSRLGKRCSSGEASPPPAKHRRKGRTQKLELISARLRDGAGSPLLLSGGSSPERGGGDRGAGAGDWQAAAHTCHSCGIAFKDLVMYTMHMGFHDYRRPFSCNKCGEECRDAIAFFLHIARVPHSS